MKVYRFDRFTVGRDAFRQKRVRYVKRTSRTGASLLLVFLLLTGSVTLYAAYIAMKGIL